jgi:circadian clock protein KaiC
MTVLSAQGLDRISTGITGLDEMLDGGLIAGRTYILSGDAGSGRSTLCAHFLMEGIRNGEEVLYVTIDSNPADISANIASFGWDVGKIMILNAHPRVREYKVRGSLIEVSSTSKSAASLKMMDDKEKAAQQQAGIQADLSLPSLQLRLQKEFEDHSYDRLVIDSVVSLKLLSSEEISWELGINSILRLLSEEGITTMIVADNPKPTEPVRPEFFMAHGIIKTCRLVASGRVYRAVYVEKMRASTHDNQVRPMRITSKGVQVDSTKTMLPEVLASLALKFPRP